MFVKDFAPGEPHLPTCKSCKGYFAPGQHIERIVFSAQDDEKLHELNGDYHRDCAAPILSVKRVLDILSGFAGR